MGSPLTDLYDVILSRKENPAEGSYTCYLFDKGLDKILKKIAEEGGETIIAAKNGDNDVTVEEIADLIYHVQVMMAAQGIPWKDLEKVLDERAKKIGNLKVMRETDRET